MSAETHEYQDSDFKKKGICGAYKSKLDKLILKIFSSWTNLGVASLVAILLYNIQENSLDCFAVIKNVQNRTSAGNNTIK